ncbi:MAG: hypothetical protein WDZ35_05975 [Crocinitomicaceae bacterium]
MKNLLRNSFLGFLVISAMVGCRKDTPVVEEANETDSTTVVNNCQDLPPEPGIGYQYLVDGPQYLAPCFNPNNSNEFVYLRTGTASVAELIKYDLLSHTEMVLCNSVNISTPPQWGRQGWITFSTTQKKVWKVYEDGSQLTQLTQGISDSYPCFNYNGNKIFYNRGINYTYTTLQQNPELYKEHKMIIVDLDGNVLDSIMIEHQNSDYTGIFGYQTWTVAALDIDGVYFFGGMVETNTYGIHKLSFQDSIITPVVILSDPGIDGSHLLGLDQKANTVYYTRQWDGIYKYDLQNSTNTKMKLGCGSKYYQTISISNDGIKLLVERINRTPLENGYEVDEQREIWLIDLTDPGKEEKILGE